MGENFLAQIFIYSLYCVVKILRLHILQMTTIIYITIVGTKYYFCLGMYRISGSYPVIRPIFHYPVSGYPVSGYPVSGYPVSGYPVSGIRLSGFVTQLSGIRPDTG